MKPLEKIIFSLIFSVASLNLSCGKIEEEKCCDCLVGNRCTTASKNRCLDTFYVFQDVDSIPVDSQCVGKNNCYLLCAAEGAYFEDGKMVVDYWKKKSLE
ncbi:MAG: hypothetical protein AABX04_03110 [Nanoarchaeota archaeon]